MTSGSNSIDDIGPTNGVEDERWNRNHAGIFNFIAGVIEGRLKELRNEYNKGHRKLATDAQLRVLRMIDDPEIILPSVRRKYEEERNGVE